MNNSSSICFLSFLFSRGHKSNTRRRRQQISCKSCRLFCYPLDFDATFNLFSHVWYRTQGSSNSSTSQKIFRLSAVFISLGWMLDSLFVILGHYGIVFATQTASEGLSPMLAFKKVGLRLFSILVSFTFPAKSFNLVIIIIDGNNPFILYLCRVHIGNLSRKLWDFLTSKSSCLSDSNLVCFSGRQACWPPNHLLVWATN